MGAVHACAVKTRCAVGVVQRQNCSTPSFPYLRWCLKKSLRGSGRCGNSIDLDEFECQQFTSIDAIFLRNCNHEIVEFYYGWLVALLNFHIISEVGFDRPLPIPGPYWALAQDTKSTYVSMNRLRESNLDCFPRKTFFSLFCNFWKSSTPPYVSHKNTRLSSSALATHLASLAPSERNVFRLLGTNFAV